MHSKVKIEDHTILYPMPVCVIGLIADGKPDFVTLAHVGILTGAPPYLFSLSMNKSHYANQWIRREKAFSLNIPSQDQVIHVDYVGIVSGKDVDKSGVFDVSYGELKNAPLIKTCPLSMECRLYDILDTPSHDVFIGEGVATHAQRQILTEGKLDLAKLRPLLFDMHSKKYWSLGPPVADCWSVGKQLLKPLV